MTHNPPLGGLAGVGVQVKDSGDARCDQQEPIVVMVDPASGPLAGGDTVTITGLGFTGATAVNFGATPASSFTVTSDTEITATSPAATRRGPVDVRVTTRDGTSAASRADQFTYTLSLNILTWNSTGETPAGAAALRGVIDDLIAQQRPPHVIVIQEANQNPSGPIYQMLGGLGNAYNQPPAHAVEGGPAGRGYLLLTHESVDGQDTFRQENLSRDQQLTNAINRLSPRDRAPARNELRGMRMPAVADLIFNGAQVTFVTWHAPRGIGQLLTGLTLPGGANPDAFYFLNLSGFYAGLTDPGVGDISVIAADLNITELGLNDPAAAWILPGWAGLSNNLDHILGHLQEGDPDFSDGENFPATGTHDIVVGTANW